MENPARPASRPRPSAAHAAWHRPIFAAFLFSLTAPFASAQQQATITATRLGEPDRFIVEADLTPGTGFATLEMQAPSVSPAWRTMIAGLIDGRAAKVSFSLPRPAGVAGLLARIRTGHGPAVPAAEITDPSLMTVTYSSGGTGVPAPVKIALLNAAGGKMREWSVLPRTERQANLIAWAKAQPNVADAYVSPLADNVCIEYTDGDTSILLNRQRTDGTTLPNHIPQPQVPSLPPDTPAIGVADGGLDRGLPGTDNAVTAYSLEAAIFPNAAPLIGTWLANSHYNVRTFGSTTVDEIKSWSSDTSPLGVLFWQAHGCSYGKQRGLEGVSIVTRQGVTPELDIAYKEMRDAGELLMAKDENETQPLYTITSRFVKKHLHFAPHSLVVLDTCYGAHLEIAGAFMSAGAGAYASWDTESGNESTTPLLQIFDRLTGSNAEPPISSPPERPFPLPIVRMWMREALYDIDPSPKYPNQTFSNARLIWQTHPEKPAHILKPTVMRVLYEARTETENFTKFLIEGDFGTDPGPGKRKLLWGGGEMNILRWHEDGTGIVIRSPGTPPAGAFQVVLQNKFTSNPSPFTEWTVPFTYQFNGRGSLQFTVKMDVKIRADIHGTRGMPEMPVQYTLIPFSNVADCTGQVSASGRYSPDPETVITWSGGTALKSVDPQITGEAPLLNLIQNAGIFNLMTGDTQGFLLMNSGFFKETVDNRATDVMAAMTAFTWPPPAVKLNLGDSTITGDTLTAASPAGDGTATLSWPTVTPVHAPTNLTPR